MPEIVCKCGSKTAVRASAAGTNVRCKGCGQQLVVPPLRVLKEFSQRGEAAPAKELAGTGNSSRPDARIPDSFVAHFYGEIGPNANISASSMQNYVAAIAQVMSAVTERIAPKEPFEIVVSCALLPEAARLVDVETAPKHVHEELVSQLEKAIREVPVPQVKDGPVAFWVYRRLNIDHVAEIGVQPFRRFQESIEQYGFEVAIARALGIEAPMHRKQDGKPTFWRRLRRLFGLKQESREEVSSVEDKQVQMKAWIEQIEERTASLPMKELKWLAVQSNQDPSGRVALAARYAQQGDFAAAVKQYTAALEFLPECAVLLERRARVNMSLSNGQAALQDWNDAIKLAPDEPWYRFYRACIYAELDAWTAAAKELEVARKQAPNEPEFALLSADVRMEMNDAESALAELEQVVQLDPNCRPAHLRLSQLLQHENCRDLNRAVDHLTRAIELLPEEIDARIYRGLLYAAQNKHELALAECDEIIGMRPEDAAGYGVRGRVLQLRGDFDEAIVACSKAIDLGLESPLVLAARGIAYAATGQPELALSDCETCLAMDPDNAMALQLHGMLQMELGDLNAAMQAFQQAVEKAPEWSEPREHLALLHRINENPQAAIDEQSILVAQSPDNPAHYVNRAFAYSQSGDYHHALLDYNRACDLDPENEHIVFLRGCFFMARQELKRALEDFDRVLSLAEDHDDARLRRASLLMQLDRHHEALVDYGKLIARHPDDPHAYTGRVYAHQLIGDEESAAGDLDRLTEIAPEKSVEILIHSLSAKVQRLSSEERYDEALITAEEIIANAPEDPMGYRLRAGIYWYTEQYVQARDDYTRLLEMAPDHSDLLNARGQLQAEMGDFQAALDDLDEAVASSREAGQIQMLAFALNGRALALAGLSRMDESESDYEESIRLCPTNAWAYYNRGIVMHRSGDDVAAKKLLQLALDAKAPALTKRKRERAQALVRKFDANQLD